MLASVLISNEYFLKVLVGQPIWMRAFDLRNYLRWPEKDTWAFFFPNRQSRESIRGQRRLTVRYRCVLKAIITLSNPWAAVLTAHPGQRTVPPLPKDKLVPKWYGMESHWVVQRGRIDRLNMHPTTPWYAANCIKKYSVEVSSIANL